MLTPEQMEIIETAYLADLYDALQEETDAEVIAAIRNQINKIERD